MECKNTCISRGTGGVYLIELMVATALGLVVATAIVMLAISAVVVLWP
jgi:Tfp pilus assembly protein PilW